MNLVDHYLANYGYLTVAAGVGAESLGLPLPGETILIAAATYAGASHRLSTSTVVVVAMAAAIVGDNIGYVIGRHLGPRLLTQLDRRLGRRSRRLRAVQQLFDRYGSLVVVAGRFVSVVRTYSAFLAGNQHMPWRRFLALNAAGGVVWAAGVGFGAAALGASMGRWASYALTAGVVGGFVLAMIALNRRRKRRLAAVTEDDELEPSALRSSPTLSLSVIDQTTTRPKVDAVDTVPEPGGRPGRCPPPRSGPQRAGAVAGTRSTHRRTGGGGPDQLDGLRATQPH